MLTAAELEHFKKEVLAKRALYRKLIGDREDAIAAREDALAYRDAIQRIHLFQRILGMSHTPDDDLYAMYLYQVQDKAAALEREIVARLAK